MRALAWGVVAVLSGGCAGPNAPSTVPADQGQAVDSSDVRAQGARGNPVEATIPLYGDGTTSLASLRGRVVVLELFSPDESKWTVAHEAWRSLRAAHPQDVEIVAVATGADDPSAVDGWDGDPPLHIVGWDPQGALALRLAVTKLPAVFVLDRLGRVAATGQDRAALRRVAESLR